MYGLSLNSDSPYVMFRKWTTYCIYARSVNILCTFFRVDVELPIEPIALASSTLSTMIVLSTGLHATSMYYTGDIYRGHNTAGSRYTCMFGLAPTVQGIGGLGLHRCTPSQHPRPQSCTLRRHGFTYYSTLDTRCLFLATPVLSISLRRAYNHDIHGGHNDLRC